MRLLVLAVMLLGVCPSEADRDWDALRAKSIDAGWMFPDGGIPPNRGQ